MKATAYAVTHLSVSAALATNDSDSLGCANCGRGIAASDAFCVYCRTKVAVPLAQLCLPAEVPTVTDNVVMTVVPASAASTRELSCVKCGRTVNESDACCIYCGNTKVSVASLTKQELKCDIPDLAHLDKLWVPDEFSNNCMECNAAFGFLKNRHHCRVCGLLFCRECVKNKMVIPASFGYTGPQSLCRGCVTALQQKTITSPADVFTQRRGGHKKSLGAEGVH